MKSKSVGIVGCGAIGRGLLKAVESGKLFVRIAGVTSRTEKSARDVLSTFKNPPPYLSLPELIAASDLIVEAAGGAVVAGLAEEVFAAGKDLMVISAGALLDPGGIGKGWALDYAARALRKRGVTSALLSFGSTMVAIGAPPGKAGWDVEIRDPFDETRTLGRVDLIEYFLFSIEGFEPALQEHAVVAGVRQGLEDLHTTMDVPEGKAFTEQELAALRSKARALVKLVEDAAAGS